VSVLPGYALRLIIFTNAGNSTFHFCTRTITGTQHTYNVPSGTPSLNLTTRRDSIPNFYAMVG